MIPLAMRVLDELRVSVRTTCCMNNASGCVVEPRICTRRDAEINDEDGVVRC